MPTIVRNRYWKVTCPYLPAHYPGTGDTFTSVITGSLMRGDSLPMALDRTAIYSPRDSRQPSAMSMTTGKVFYWKKVLHNLDMPIQMASYELI